MKSSLTHTQINIFFRSMVLALLVALVHAAQAQVGNVDSLYTYTQGFNNTVMGGVVLPDSVVIVYGNFTNCNGKNVNRIVALNQDGSINNSFNPGTGANAQVNTASVQSDGKIIIAGQFTQYNGRYCHVHSQA